MDRNKGIMSVWSFESPVAKLHCGQLAGEVDVSRPQLGVSNAAFGSYSAGSVFCVRRCDDSASANAGLDESASRQLWPLAVADAYVRGNDLIGAYQASEDWPYSPQIYWRADSLLSVSGVVGSLALLVSVQTHLLDTWPRIEVSSQLASDEVFQIVPSNDGLPRVKKIASGDVLQPGSEPCCIVRRLSKLPLSYIEIMPGGDFRCLSITSAKDGGWSTRWELFGEFLEKGVIWRARVQSALVPREKDIELAAACCDAMEQSALPLTV